MDFGLTADQLAIRDSVRNWARRELAAGYLRRAQSAAFPWDVHRKVADLGVLGLLAGPGHSPVEHDAYVVAGLAIEELAYTDFNVANAAIPVLLMSALIAEHAGDEVRER